MSEAGPASPPGQKRVVVLREGPPKGRGKALDGVLGVVGALLLLLAVLLVNVLPEEEVPDPQFRVEYVSVPVELVGSVLSTDLLPATNGVLAVGAGNAVDVPYEFADNNIFEIVVQLTPTEDFEESLPDTLMVELFDPNGQSIAISSPQPTYETAPAPNSVPPSYETPLDNIRPHKITFNIGGKPEDRIVSFEDGRNATLEEAEATLVAQDTRPTEGTWTVRVWVESAGQCPQAAAGTNPSEVQRVQVCETRNQRDFGGNGDAGNPFILNSVEYTYYDIVVSEA